MPPTVTGAIENLRERGLLPVAIVLVAAILAVPFLLSGGSSSPPPPKAEPSAAAAADAIQTQQAVVLANNPGVREYKKRLDGSAMDPFFQQYKVPEERGRDRGHRRPAGRRRDRERRAHGNRDREPERHVFDARRLVGARRPLPLRRGSLRRRRRKKNPKLWRNVKRTTSLPNKNVKVAAFIGVPIDKPDVATFLVSSDVVNIAGKGKCTLGGDGCELISVKVGDQIKLTAANGVTYAIKVADTYIVHDKTQ